MHDMYQIVFELIQFKRTGLKYWMILLKITDFIAESKLSIGNLQFLVNMYQMVFELIQFKRDESKDWMILLKITDFIADQS